MLNQQSNDVSQDGFEQLETSSDPLIMAGGNEVHTESVNAQMVVPESNVEEE
jgi:hypothetical protein